MNGYSPNVLIMLALAFVVFVAASVWFGLVWYRQKQAREAQARKLAERQERRQKKRDDRHKVREQEVSAVRSARANGDRRPVVLVVDDSPTALEAARRVLEDHRYRVVTAVHGREAWSMLQDLHPDIILSDIEMPYVDGFQLLRMVRADLALTDIPVVFMTSNAIHHIRAGKEKGIDGFLSKPYREEDLIEQLQYLLQE